MAEEGAPSEETLEQLEARHEAEAEELEGRAKAHLEAAQASAGKGKKAKSVIEAAEREVEQWRYDLTVRHKDEVEALEERLAGGGGGAGGAEAPAAAAAAAVSAGGGATAAAAGRRAEDDDEDGNEAGLTEAERAQRKKDKALRKRQNRSRKEQEREEEKEREKLSAGPSHRQVELASIVVQLAKQTPPLKVFEVPGDGHCLYRAVADQLRRYRPDLHKWAKAPALAHEEVREVCAKALRAKREDYEPFAELADGEDFGGYCDRVERSADWGGELELRALAAQLGARIVVHRAGEPEPLVLGEAAKGAPLHVTYHRHWYALGEHYNSAVVRGGEGDGED